MLRHTTHMLVVKFYVCLLCSKAVWEFHNSADYHYNKDPISILFRRRDGVVFTADYDQTWTITASTMPGLFNQFPNDITATLNPSMIL